MFSIWRVSTTGVLWCRSHPNLTSLVAENKAANHAASQALAMEQLETQFGTIMSQTGLVLPELRMEFGLEFIVVVRHRETAEIPKDSTPLDESCGLYPGSHRL